MKKNSPDAVMPSSERDLGKRLRRRTNFVEICKYFDKENFEENGRAASTSNTEKDEIKIWEFDIDLSAEKSNRISPKSKSRKTGIGLECQLPENSHLKKDTPGGLTPVKKTKSQEHREVRKLEPFEDNEIIFKISRFNYVGLWQWDVDTDICAICLVDFRDPCHTCQSNGWGCDDCEVVWGSCNHSFHNCCMYRWMAQTQFERCPLCQQDWIVERVGN